MLFQALQQFFRFSAQGCDCRHTSPTAIISNTSPTDYDRSRALVSHPAVFTPWFSLSTQQKGEMGFGAWSEGQCGWPMMAQREREGRMYPLNECPPCTTLFAALLQSRTLLCPKNVPSVNGISAWHLFRIFFYVTLHWFTAFRVPTLRAVQAQYFLYLLNIKGGCKMLSVF